VPDTVLSTEEAAVKQKCLALMELIFLFVRCDCVLIKKVNHILASEVINAYNYKIT